MRFIPLISSRRFFLQETIDLMAHSPVRLWQVFTNICQATSSVICLMMFCLITISFNAAASVTTDVEDKLYRQALYFYFAGDYAAALRQVSLNHQRYKIPSPKSDLFEAGLQVAVGLHHRATQTLVDFEKDLNRTQGNDEHRIIQTKTQSKISSQELLLVALLQLTEQQIQQGNIKAAQQTFGRISKVPKLYREQYQVLNQLVNWPNVPDQADLIDSTVLTADSADDRKALTSAYIQLNQALLHINRGQYLAAKHLLIPLKSKTWHVPESNFWQRLFNPLDESDIRFAPGNDKHIQQQAINDYAQLLLAQMYVKQENFQATYQELKNFPKDSPYTESALYLFAYAAQKSQHYPTSLKLLDLMQQQYGYSHLGWQAALLKAMQVESNRSLGHALASYQKAEQLYQRKITELSTFQKNYLANKDPLSFSPELNSSLYSDIQTTAANQGVPKTLPSSSNTVPFTLMVKTPYTSASPWLNKALLVDANLQDKYKNLIELDLLYDHMMALKQQSDWLNHTISLNQQRQTRVLKQRQLGQYGNQISKLTEQEQRISQIIFQAEEQSDGQVFATHSQRQLLQRIQQSEQRLLAIAPHRDIQDSQQRLTRVKGVLAWQLQIQLPQRLWQHKKILKEVKQQLDILTQKNQQFEAQSKVDQRSANFAQRQQKTIRDIDKTLVNIAEYRQQTSEEIHQKVNEFVAQQHRDLAKLLLTTRHKMAGVLEKMSSVKSTPIETSQVIAKAAEEAAIVTSGGGS